MLKVRRPSPVLTSVEAVPSGHVAPVDDNFAFIDQLLDTLQSEGDSGKGQTADAAQEREGNAGSDCFPGMDDLQDSPTSLMIDSTAVLDNDTLSALITRFCEEGDESIVDRLLDNFLKSTSDAGNLVDAIGKPYQLHSRKTPFLNLDQMKKSDPLDKSADSWDALLNSARGVLLSARASQSPQSPPGSLPDSPKSILSSADGRRKRRGRSSSSRDAGQQLSEEVAPVGEAEILTKPTKQELLARLASQSQEDPDAVRNFLKNFLIGVRQRCLLDLPTDSEQSEFMEEDVEDGAESVWTCRSVETDTQLAS